MRSSAWIWVLLIDAQDDGVRRGRQIQPDHIVDLRGRVRIRRELERLVPMGLQRMPAPDALHGAGGHADALRHCPGTPVRQPRRGRLDRERHNARPGGGADRRRPAGAGPLAYAQHALPREAGAQATDLYHRVPGAVGNRGIGQSVRHEQNGAGPTTQARRRRRRADQALQDLAIPRRDGDRALVAMGRSSRKIERNILA